MRSLRTSHFNYPLPGPGYGLAAALLLFFTAFSAVAAAQTPPGAPTGLTATVTESWDPWQIDLSWTAPASNGGAEISGYKIEYSTNPPPDDNDASWGILVANNPSTDLLPHRPGPRKGLLLSGLGHQRRRHRPALQRRQRRRNTLLQRAVQRTAALPGVGALHNRRPLYRKDGDFRPPLGVLTHLRLRARRERRQPGALLRRG